MSSDQDKSLQGLKMEARKATTEQHPEELRLVEDLLTSCLRGFTSLGSFTPGEDNRVQHAQLLLAARSFSSVRCAYELLLLGYYMQALTVIRSSMEDDLTALDCEKHPATVEAILNGKEELGKGKLRYTEMAKRQGERFWEAWKNNYGQLSEYAAHARYKSVRSMVDLKANILLLGGYYDRELFIGVCDALLSAVIRAADVVARVLGSEAESWQEETYPKLKAAKKWRGNVKAKVEARQDV